MVGRGDRARGLRARTTDRFEDVVAWALTTCAAATVLLAVAIGQFGSDATLARANAEAAARTPARAELLEDVDGVLVADGSPPRTAPARWTAPDGRVTQGRVIVSSPHASGDTVPIWLDRTGRLVPAPMQASSATVVGWTWGVAVVLGGWAMLALLWTGVRGWTARRNAAGWAREWALVEPSWSGRVP
ncbi:MAG TPA: hypothetical protein VGE11_08680 [Pseudonocardia sp.]